MPNLFFLLSGEHPTLPIAELKAILEAEGFKYRESAQFPQVAILDTDEGCIEPIVSRSSMVKACGIELFHCEADRKEIYEKVKAVNVEKFVKPGESFAVRIRRIQLSSPELRTDLLEREIGEFLLESFPFMKVDLKRPSKTFFGILSGESFIFGLKMAEIPTMGFRDRSPMRRPFFHPSTMLPKMARCLVNLARVKRGNVLLDPFCGAGGILIEGGLIGCQVVGSDVKESMVKGALSNLEYYGIETLGLFVADARELPVARADVIVTDLPYGRSATTLRMSTEQILREFLPYAYDILPENGFACVVAPDTVRLSELGRKMGFKIVEEHVARVHGTLTRVVTVLRK